MFSVAELCFLWQNCVFFGRIVFSVAELCFLWQNCVFCGRSVFSVAECLRKRYTLTHKLHFGHNCCVCVCVCVCVVRVHLLILLSGWSVHRRVCVSVRLCVCARMCVCEHPAGQCGRTEAVNWPFGLGRSWSPFDPTSSLMPTTSFKSNNSGTLAQAFESLSLIFSGATNPHPSTL